jgi:hypothetical protein
VAGRLAGFNEIAIGEEDPVGLGPFILRIRGSCGTDVRVICSGGTEQNDKERGTFGEQRTGRMRLEFMPTADWEQVYFK